MRTLKKHKGRKEKSRLPMEKRKPSVLFVPVYCFVSLTNLSLFLRISLFSFRVIVPYGGPQGARKKQIRGARKKTSLHGYRAGTQNSAKGTTQKGPRGRQRRRDGFGRLARCRKKYNITSILVRAPCKAPLQKVAYLFPVYRSIATRAGPKAREGRPQRREQETNSHVRML